VPSDAAWHVIMGSKRLDSLPNGESFFDVPNSDGAETAPGDHSTIRRESDGPNGIAISVGNQFCSLPASGYVPESHGAVFPARCQCLAVGGESHAVHPISWTNQG